MALWVVDTNYTLLLTLSSLLDFKITGTKKKELQYSYSYI